MPAPREPNTVQPWDRPCLHGGLAWNHAMMTKDGLIFEANSLKQGRLQALTRQQLQAQATQNRERRWMAPQRPPVTRPPTCRLTRPRAWSQASILNRFASSLAGG